MVESQVDFKWEGKLPEVLSNTELRCHLYFFQGQSGRSVESGLRRVNMGMGREDWLCNTQARGNTERMAESCVHEDKGKDTCYTMELSCPDPGAPWGSYCRSSCFHGTPKPKEIPNGSVY